MNCKKAVKSIKAFLNDDLDTYELKSFLEHIEECPECKEELTIEIMVNEGLSSLESGSNFDLKKEYNKRIAGADRLLKKRESLRTTYYMISGLVGVELITVLLLIIFM